jgi:hypothetical protein
LTLKRAKEAAATREQIAQVLGMDAFEGDAHALLMAVYMNPKIDLDMRIEAAKAALPYEKPRLQAISVADREQKDIVITFVGAAGQL